MSSLNRVIVLIPRCVRMSSSSSQLGDLGSGAGKGGGGGGAIRSAGGAFGKMEAAREEEFFYKQSKQQLSDLKDGKITQEEFHSNKIKEHEEALNRHKENLTKIKN